MAWVVSQGSEQVIHPGWWAFRYAAVLLGALVLALAALIVTTKRPPVSSRIGLAIQVVAGLETLAFGLTWISLAVVPLSSP